MPNPPLNLQSVTVGPRSVQDGGSVPPRGERTGAMVVQHAHGEYYEEAARGNVWTISTAVAGVAIVTGVGQLATAANNPIVGVFNQTSNINCHITRAIIVVVAGTSVTGGFVWGISTNPTGITSAGVGARNNKTFLKSGHAAAAFDGSAALTGQTAAPVLFRAFGGQSAGAAAGAGTNTTFEETETDIVIGPGAYAGLYAGVICTGTTVVGSISWAEVST